MIPVGVLGATGAVGQAFVRLLAAHPWFELRLLAASEQSAGTPYGDAVRWREPAPLPDRVAALPLLPATAPSAPTDRLPLLFSALENTVAGPLEAAWAAAGSVVVSNAAAHRMDPLVPLLVAEVNPDHAALLEMQRRAQGGGRRGGIVANPNCSTAALVLALAPLAREFGVERVFVATLQAVSGAGYPGVASLDILGNVIPYIGQEEEKLERETRKLLGQLTAGGDAVREAPIGVSAHCNRVPVEDGHTLSVSVGLTRKAAPPAVAEALQRFRAPERVAGLPSSPATPVEVDPRPDRPQPLRDKDRGAGMTVTVGRVRACPLLDVRFTVLGHNRIRGAAGGAVQLGELLVAQGALA